MRKVFYFVYIIFVHHYMYAQSLSNEELQKSEQTRYLALYSENDVYQYTYSADKYFTNGLRVEMSHPVFDNKVARAILMKNKGEYKSEFSLRLAQDIYTPADISTTEVDSSDRPYCGLLYFAYTRHSNNFKIGRKVVSRLFVGVQGPIAGAAQMQTWFHKTIDNDLPQGWDNQIGNGLALDYEVKEQRMLPIKTRYWEVSVNTILHLGTIYNFAQTGLLARFGLFNYSYYQYDGLYSSRSKKGTYTIEDTRWREKRKRERPEKARSRTTFINKDFQCYAYANLNFGYMFYDGTAQGSLIPFEKSTYTLKYNDLGKDYGHLVQGITLSYRSFQIQYERVIKRDVFKGSGYYGWGQIRILFGL